MKIKLAMLEKDQSYLNRIVTVFSTKYADKFEIYSFTDLEIAMKALEEARIDVFVASDAFEIDVAAIPKRCGFAYFVDSVGIDSVNDQVAICKFQKADLIYKQVLSIYSENTDRAAGFKLHEDNCKVIVFSSPAGGVGTSCIAAACARYLSGQGKKTLYLDLERMNSVDAMFSGDGQFDMSDIIYAIKSKKANLSLKLESCVKQDEFGVSFYSAPKNALDMMELKWEDIRTLFSELKLKGAYDYIIVDADFSLSQEHVEMFRKVNTLVLISDGSAIANTKVKAAYDAFAILDANHDVPILARTALMYNKFSNKTGNPIAGITANAIGGAPRYEHATAEMVIKQLAGLSVFEKIM